MKIEIDIPDNKLQNLSQTAKTELVKIAGQYAEEVLDEASRIEESRRTSNQNPEITASIINDAVFFAQTHGIRKRKPKKHVFMQGLALISSTFTGGLFNTDKFNQILYLVLFLTAFAIAVVSGVYLILNDNNHE